jgi:stage II sporulation protein M
MGNIINFHRQLFRENRPWFCTAFIWFVLTFLFGGAIYFFFPGFLETIVNMFRDKFAGTPDLSITLAKDIFINNLIATGFALFAGAVLGLGSLLVIGVNGFIFGYVVTSLFVISNTSVSRTILFVLAGIVPHGIFELSAFFIAGAMGLKLGLEWLGTNATGNRFKTFGSNFVKNLYVIPLLVLLLLVAAFMEVFVSGRLVDKFF